MPRALLAAISLTLLTALPAALPAASPAFAQGELGGTYRVTGANPGGQGTYQGRAEIRQTGETYRIVWRIGQTEYAGNAIRLDDHLAVVYVGAGGTVEEQVGIVHYRIETDGSLTGVWTSFGGTEVGTEIWMPEGRL